MVADDGDDDDVVEVSSEGTDGDEEYQVGWALGRWRGVRLWQGWASG